MSKKPIILITGSDGCDRVAQWTIKWAVRLAGGKPKLVTPKTCYKGDFDGLILSGGVDIHPNRYHSSAKLNYPYELARDELEYAWLERSRALNKPVMGICRGAQLMNVYCKGTLHLDVSKAYEEAQYSSSLIAKIVYRKRMYLERSSLLYQIFRRDSLKVNSLHTQSIDCLGRDLVVSAREKNGVIQAVEDSTRAFYIGVQFHPEFLIYSEYYRRLFKKLIQQAREERVNSPSHR